jgi:hypothetical protein
MSSNYTQLGIDHNNVLNEYRTLYETFIKATSAMDGDKLSRELKRDLNAALDKAAARFNKDALKLLQATKTI